MRNTFHTLPETCPDNAEGGAWHLKPFQQLWEAGLTALISTMPMVWFWGKFRTQLRREARTAAPLLPPSLFVRLVDVILLVVMIVSAATVIYHKWAGNKLSFLLQPCHVLHSLLLFLLTLPRGSDTGAVLLAVYLNSLSAPFLGTVAVDLSCYTQRFEALNWGVQHVMLLVAPLYLLATRRFGSHVHSSAALFHASYFAMALLHYGILIPFSMWTTTNINYVLCPPAGQSLLVSFGRWYRPPMMLVCFLLAALLRFIVVAAFVRVVCPQAAQVTESDTKAPASSSSSKTLGQVLSASDKLQEGLRQRHARGS